MLARGAEAVIEKVGNVVVKRRIKKGYRMEELDERIRRERTKKEARLMRKASPVIDVPKVLEVGDYEIRMEFIDGKRLKECMSRDLAREIGRMVGKLHSIGIAHNDLTTSNMILKDGRIFLIDFGLAEMGGLEEFATDLKVLKDSIKATHPELDLWQGIIEGYREEMKDWKKVLERLDRLESMGRYKVRTPR